MVITNDVSLVTTEKRFCLDIADIGQYSARSFAAEKLIRGGQALRLPCGSFARVSGPVTGELVLVIPNRCVSRVLKI